jgi:hypothetical protein
VTKESEGNRNKKRKKPILTNTNKNIGKANIGKAYLVENLV